MHTPISSAVRVMKVNHAGEHGAIGIYTGQILMARLTARALVPELRAFRAHEEGHRAIFRAELKRLGAKQCKSYWLCALVGYALGIATGLFGTRAIALTTVAVERVVLRHLRHQIASLTHDPQAVVAISAIVNEEQQHHDTAAAHTPAVGALGKMLDCAVAGTTESVIWMGMRL